MELHSDVNNTILSLEKIKQDKVGGAFVQAKGDADSQFKFICAKVGKQTAYVSII